MNDALAPSEREELAMLRAYRDAVRKQVSEALELAEAPDEVSADDTLLQVIDHLQQALTL